MKKDKIDFQWLICPNCGSKNLDHYEFKDRETGEVVKRITYCRDCHLNVVEFFGIMVIQKKKPNILKQDEFNKYLPLA